MKKKIWLLLTYLLWYLGISAQTIQQVEYFIDADPGYGNGINVPISPNANLTNFSFDVQLDNVSEGLHLLYVRAKDEQNRWTELSYRLFAKLLLPATPPAANIMQLEYFIDQDPGLGNGNNVPISPTLNLNEFTFSLDVAQLTDGIHFLYVRAKDEQNRWTELSYRLFAKLPLPATPSAANITQLEYFIDQDPGLGNGNNVPISPTLNLNEFTFSLDVAQLTDGIHFLYVRAKDEQNRWTELSYRLFLKQPISQVEELAKINKAEYFIDNDPGLGNGIAIPLTPASNIENLFFEIDIAALSPGNHTVFVRVKDEQEKWSEISSHDFAVLPPCSSASMLPNTLPNPSLYDFYSQVLSQTGISGTLNWTIQEGFLPEGLSLNPSTGSIEGIPLYLGDANFIIGVSNGNCILTKSYTISVLCPEIEILPETLPIATTGSEYYQQLMASRLSDSFIWELFQQSNLPEGLTLNNQTGEITGIPVSTGDFNFTVELTFINGNEVCQQTKSYTLTVGCPAISIFPSTLASGVQEQFYHETLIQDGLIGNANWSISEGQLPNGISLDNAGILSGTPTDLGSFNFTIKASQGSCEAFKAYTLEICPNQIDISPAFLQEAIHSVGYTQTLTQNTLSGNLSWRVIAGSLPSGLSLSNDGIIAGTPNGSGLSSFTVEVSNGSCTGIHNYTIQVNCPQITINPTVLPIGELGISYAHTLTQSGLIASVNWSIASGNLPPGLSLSTTGQLTGIPFLEGVYNVSFTVSGVNCSQTSGVYAFTITTFKAPSNLNVLQSISDRGATLTWIDNTLSETGFKIERKNGLSDTFSEIAMVNTNITTYTDEDLTLSFNNTYCYRVRAYNAANNTHTGYSNEECFDLLITANEQNLLSSLVEVFPNPSQSIFEIKAHQILKQDLYYYIYDIYGKAIIQGRMYPTNIGFEMNVNLEQQSQGTYFLKIYTEDGTSVIKRLVKY